MYHTPSHMDGYLEAEDLDTASIYNTMAEKLADEYYHLDQSTVDNADLTQYLFGSFYHDNFPITVPFRKWAHQQVTITRSRRHYTTNHPLVIALNLSSLNFHLQEHEPYSHMKTKEGRQRHICVHKGPHKNLS